MASAIPFKTSLPALDAFNSPNGASIQTTALTLGLVAVGIAIFFFHLIRKISGFPTVTAEFIKDVSKEGTAPQDLAVIKFFKDMLDKFDHPFSVSFRDRGNIVILPPRYTDDVKNNKDMSLSLATSAEFFSSYPGFDAFKITKTPHASRIFNDAVRAKLTQALAFFTDDLSEETNTALTDTFPRTDDWQKVQLFPTMLDLVTRLSLLIFLGRDFEYMKAWQDISASYAVNVFEAARVLRLWNPLLRPFVHWFLPETAKVRAQVKEARSIVEPEVQRRRANRREAVKNGTAVKKSLDSVDWFEDCSGGADFDTVAGELTLSMAAIHTTTSTVINTLLDICSHPEIVQPIRDEIAAVVQEDNGLVRTTLHKLKLLDSVMKESQRLHPIGTARLQRTCTADVKLHDGIVLPRSTVTMSPLTPHFDPELFPDPYTFDGYRFFNLRKR